MQTTNETFKRGRGRPVTGKALTAAEKQRAYRGRQKEKLQALEIDADFNQSEFQSVHIETLEKLQQSLIEENEKLRAKLQELEQLLGQVNQDNENLLDIVTYWRTEAGILKDKLTKKRNVTKKKLKPDNTPDGYQQISIG